MEDFKKKAEEIRQSLAESSKDNQAFKNNPPKYHLDTIKSVVDTMFDSLRLTLLPVIQDYDGVVKQYPDILPDVDNTANTLNEKLIDITSILTSVHEKTRELAIDVNDIVETIADSVKKRHGVEL